ncbi:MAG: protein BatD [Candidatus Omnitrophica bacterium]|nr:protein BatD [Candidatus Omnitrophota bacterium]
MSLFTKRCLTIVMALLAAAALHPHAACADNVKFEATVDRGVIALGESAQIGLAFYGTQEMPSPEIGEIDGFETRYVGPTTMMTVINGRISTSVTHIYRLTPLRTGKFQIGPFSFTYRGNNYTSNAVSLEVVEEKAAVQPRRVQRIEEEAPAIDAEDFKDRIFLTLSAAKTSAFVNELVPVTVKLYVNRLNVSDIQLPTFAQEGFSKIEFKEPRQTSEMLGGLMYDVLEFKTNIFGTKAGEYKLGPAKIKCNIIVRKRVAQRPPRPDDFFDSRFDDRFFDDFFTRTERYPIELKSREIPITISPLPRAGMPADFSGAVGDYQFIYKVNPNAVKTGDPLTLTMEINGTGNFNTVIMPRMEGTDGFRIYEPQIKTGDNQKVFTQVLIPETETLTATPKAVFTYFDPKKAQYKTIAQSAIPIRVEKAKEEAPAQVVGPASGALREAEAPVEPKRDIIYIKESPGHLCAKGGEIYRNKAFLVFLPMPLIALIALSVVSTRREKLRRNARYAGRVMAMRHGRSGLRSVRRELRRADSARFYDTVFKTLQLYLGNRLGIPPAGITADTVEAEFAARQIDADVRHKVRNLFQMCDEAKFAQAREADSFRMESDAKTLEQVIRYFERARL